MGVMVDLICVGMVCGTRYDQTTFAGAIVMQHSI